MCRVHRFLTQIEPICSQSAVTPSESVLSRHARPHARSASFGRIHNPVLVRSVRPVVPSPLVGGRREAVSRDSARASSSSSLVGPPPSVLVSVRAAFSNGQVASPILRCRCKASPSPHLAHHLRLPPFNPLRCFGVLLLKLSCFLVRARLRPVPSRHVREGAFGGGVVCSLAT